MTSPERERLRLAISSARRARAAVLDDADDRTLLTDPHLAEEIARQYVMNGLSLRTIAALLDADPRAVLQVLATSHLLSGNLLVRRSDAYRHYTNSELMVAEGRAA